MVIRFLMVYCLGASGFFQVLTIDAQTTTIGQFQGAFSSAGPVTKVALSGSALWSVGSLKDSGTVNLVAASDGSLQMQLTLDKSGVRTEIQSAVAPNMTCQWSGSDAKVHQTDYLSCLTPTVWFLPALTLQTGSTLSSFTVSDLGVKDTSEGSAHHLRTQFSPALFSDDTTITTQSQAGIADLDVDPASFLPISLTYKVRPDDGRNIDIPILVKFSDYRNVNGVKVPYLIERYVNGTLQLSITVQSSQIN
jgi:hypothetical protein